MKIKKIINKIKFVKAKVAKDLIYNLNSNNYVIFIGLHGIAEYLYNNKYRIAVDNAKYIFCDSVFVQFLFFIYNKKIPNKSPGPDVSKLLIDDIILNNLGMTIFGGNKNVMTSELKKKEFNNFQIIDPGLIDFNNIENCNEAKKILKSKNKFNFIAISTPKQEVIAYHYFKHFSNSIFIPVGAAINFYFNLEKRAPLIFRKLGIEFLWRSFFAPRKMWKRSIYSLYKIISIGTFKK